MKLNMADARLFFELWIPLLNFANKKFNVCPELNEIKKSEGLAPKTVRKIAEYIWNDVEIIDEYLENNPSISKENSLIIKSWKNRKKGRFVIARHLKTGSVFISADDNEVYLVKGLMSSWPEMLIMLDLPLLVNAVLIPFKDNIISDGVVVPEAVSFGTNYKKSFRSTYMNAQKNGTLHKILK